MPAKPAAGPGPCALFAAPFLSATLLVLSCAAIGCGPKRPATADTPKSAAAPDAGRSTADVAPALPRPPANTGQLAVFVEAEAAPLGAPKMLGTDGAITLTLRDPNGKTHRMGAPATWCGAVPGRWQIRAEAPGYMPAGTTVTVQADQPMRVDLKLAVAGRLTVLKTSPVSTALLTPPPRPAGTDDAEGQPKNDGASIGLPHVADLQLPGLYTLTPVNGAAIAIVVPPTEAIRVHATAPGLVIGGLQHALAADDGKTPVPVESFDSGKKAPSFYRQRRGRRSFRKRKYDLGPVKKLSELQWKVRSVIVHSHVGPIEEAMKDWVQKRFGRHLVITKDGRVLQLLDLVEEARGVGHLIDETTIHVSVAADSDRDTTAQQRALATVMGTLSRLLPRVQPSFPTNADGTPVRQRLVDPRAHKGWMQTHHVVHPDEPSKPNAPSPPTTSKATPKTDTGTPDTGPADSATLDAASDAGPEDAGPEDAGPGAPGRDPGPLFDENALQKEAMALFDRRHEISTDGRSDDGFRSLTVRASLAPNPLHLLLGTPPTAAITLTRPDGAITRGSSVAVICQPKPGRWHVEATASDHAMERRYPQVPAGSTADVLTELSLSRVGDVIIAGTAGIETTLVGPGGLEMVVKLPYKGDGLKAGTYRLSVDRTTTKLEPFRMGFRIDAAKTTRLTVPDLNDPTLPAILINGEPYPLPRDIKVVNYRDPDALSFYAAQVEIGDADRVFMQRVLPNGRTVDSLAEVASVAHMVVLHADVIKDTARTFEVLASKGLSTHFGIEWDGTIYQMLDPRDGAFAAAEVNPYSVQIDLNNLLPNLVTDPRSRPYPRPHPRSKEMAKPEFKRAKSRRVSINGRDVRSFGYTDAQYRSLIALMQVLSGALTRIAPEVPLEANGTVPLNFFDGAEHFDGIVAHWHLTPRRWDPGPGFDWQRFRRGLAGQTENAQPVPEAPKP